MWPTTQPDSDYVCFIYHSHSVVTERWSNCAVAPEVPLYQLKKDIPSNRVAADNPQSYSTVTPIYSSHRVTSVYETHVASHKNLAA